MKKFFKFYLVFVLSLNLLVNVESHAQTAAGKKVEFELGAESDRNSAIAGFQKIALWLANLGLLIGLLVVVKKMVTGEHTGYKALLNWVIAACIVNLLIYEVPRLFLDNNISVKEYQTSK